MRIVIAPDKFKGCLAAREVAAAIAEGIRRASPQAEIEQIPMADGGEGTVEALVAATNGRLLTQRVTGPLPEMQVDATFGILGDQHTAVIEMSAASGLHYLRPDQYNPLNTTTYGTGELLNAATAIPGIRQIILGIGGSATVDGGIGCAQACGFEIELEGGKLAPSDRPLCGTDVARVTRISSNSRKLEGIQIIVASDVSNPLTGSTGAAKVFGPQKGATPSQVNELDNALLQLANRTGKQDAAQTPGAGAAGGLGFAMLAYFNATLRSGFDVVAKAGNLEARMLGADLVITAEGRLDSSSLHGKTTLGVARLCKRQNTPCIALAGSIGEGADAALEEGLTAYFAITNRPMTLEDAMSSAPRLLTEAAGNVARLFFAR